MASQGFHELPCLDVEADACCADVVAGNRAAEPAAGGLHRGRRGWRLALGLGAAAGTAAIAAVALSSSGRRGVAASSDGSATVAVTLDEEAAKAEPSEDTTPSTLCSAEGENCLQTKCCLDGGENGLQCYAKDEYWASCSETCKKGVHKGEKHGTYDKYGTLHLDEWSCAEHGDRSEPGCSTFGNGTCPEDRCMWKQDSCSTSCDLFTSESGCATNDKCMWKGKCMEACDTLESEDTCKPTDKCMWKNGKCQEGCWTFGADTCTKHDRCTMVGSECKDNCWTNFEEDACGKHDRCMWTSQRKCKPACSTFFSKDSCPGDAGCKWDYKPDGTHAACMPDPCAAPGEDCSQSKCCSSQRGAAGFTCFQKDQYYATCMPGCDAEADDKKKEKWSCKALGNRSAYDPGCAWAGKSCEKESLCCNIGFNCLVKDDVFTGCVQTVKKSTWMTQQVPLPGGWRGTFVGAGRTEYQVPSAGPNEAVADNSLYCFMAFLPDSPEVQLMQVAKQNKASIFACDASDVFHSWQSTKSGWDTGEATLTNTDVFINVWEQVHKAGRYNNFEWTAKVDADAVLVPYRLKQHIAALRPPAGRAIYLKNNAMDKGLGNNGFLGAVEVFSKVAMHIYYDNAEGCHTTLGIQAGEDGFFKGCMDALGVGFMVDSNMFNPDSSAGVCVMQERAAFHPLKQPVDWQCCWDIINGKPHNVVYGHCDLGYELKITG